MNHTKKPDYLFHMYEHFITPVALVAGFIVDSIALNRVDIWVNHISILLYLFVTASAIVLINAHDAGRIEGAIVKKISRIATYGMQWAFGGLFSAFLVFYSKSASFAASGVFLLLLTLLFIGNEFFRKRYMRLAFQVGVFFIALFSYFIFLVPLITKEMGIRMFLMSGLISLAAVAVLLWGLWRVIPFRLKDARKSILESIAVIYIAFHALYFSNIIPPIPLALKEIGVYHAVRKTEGGDYAVRYEPAPWYAIRQKTDDVFHWRPGQAVYLFASVFSPADIGTGIFHRWSYFDSAEQRWVESSRFGFPIVGGRERGYRGYTFKENMFPGKWRVDVMTERGQVVSRFVFRVEKIEGNIGLVESIR